MQLFLIILYLTTMLINDLLISFNLSSFHISQIIINHPPPPLSPFISLHPHLLINLIVASLLSVIKGQTLSGPVTTKSGPNTCHISRPSHSCTSNIINAMSYICLNYCLHCQSSMSHSQTDVIPLLSFLHIFIYKFNIIRLKPHTTRHLALSYLNDLPRQGMSCIKNNYTTGLVVVNALSFTVI